MGYSQGGNKLSNTNLLYLRTQPLAYSSLHAPINVQAEMVRTEHSIVEEIVSFDAVILQLSKALVAKIFELIKHFTLP